MLKRRAILLASFLAAFLVLASMVASGIGAFPSTSRASAQDETETPTATPGPNRKKVLTVDYTRYTWWVTSWKTNQILCALAVEHEGLPDGAEIKQWCDAATYSQWQITKPCPEASTYGDVTQCTGVYMHFVNSKPAQRQVTVNLPPPDAWISLTGCNPVPPTNICSTRPNLLITGEEPLPNETIISVQGTFRGEAFSCMGATCAVPVPATGMQGDDLEFWVDSSFGDSSQHFSAKVRMVPWGDFVAPDGKNNDPRRWYIDVISDRWRGAPSASCSQIWLSFPDLGGPPAWLSTPPQLNDLITAAPLYYLAGSLIQSGQVDAKDCPAAGLQSQGVANACGLERAKPAVVEWQNQFDAQILQASQDTGLPAQLMKNIFNRESQFWPGIFRTYKEAGLGQLTEKGADTVLLWNPSFYNQFCPLIFEKSVCNQNFKSLGDNEQNMLRGALVNKVNAACPDCPAGIDLTQATFSVNVFASTILANCEQAGQVVYNATNKAAGLSSSYVDLWKFTLVNYNAGSGCLEEAVNQAKNEGKILGWDNVSADLDEACQGSIAYVNDISSMGPQPTATSTPASPLLITPAPQTPAPTLPGTPGLTSTPGPTSTPTVRGSTPTPKAKATATQPGYPYPAAPTATPGPSPTIEPYP